MALIAGFALAGCVTYNVRADLGNFDVSIPVEEQCTLRIGIESDSVRNILTENNSRVVILSFDGEPVYWPWHSKIRIPAGRHTLSCSGSSWNTNYTDYGSYTEARTTTIEGEDTLVYIFEAGKTYKAGFGSRLYIEETR